MGERERKGDVNRKEEPVTTLTAVMATVGQTQETAGGDDVTRSKTDLPSEEDKDAHVFFSITPFTPSTTCWVEL